VSSSGWARVAEGAFNAALFAYVAGMVGYFAYLAFRRDPVLWIARAVTVAGLAANVLAIVSRGVAAGRVPWGNMYEYSTLLAALVVGATLVVVEGMYRIRTLTGFALMFAVFTMAIAATSFFVPVGPLVPALNSYWIKIHVVAAISGSSLLALGGLLTILYLLKDRAERKSLIVLRQADPPPIMGGAVGTDAPPGLVTGADEPVGLSAGHRGVLPPAVTLDRIAYRVIAFAFPIWTFAVIAGAIWAQDAWGRYWGWDPKETWSFITWVIFAGYLHARATAGWRGRRAAVIALVGFVSLLITYYAVNLWIVGLHSYAK
jgi:cytochrome c-type biogenesis protein CcsB